MQSNLGVACDASISGKKIGFKCKHREVRPYPTCDFDATIPVSSQTQAVDYFCFGQIAKGMNDGFILGVMSKTEFYSNCGQYKAGHVANNGQRYAGPTDYVWTRDLLRWQKETIGGFFPLRYLGE